MEAVTLFNVTRHGRTIDNGKNLYRGLSNGPDAQLSPAGREDVRSAGIWYKNNGLTFPRIYVDDLSRTQESAHILADILGIREIITDPRLEGLDVGDFTGKSKDEYPLNEYIKNRNKKIPGGESLNHFDKRQSEAFDDILTVVIDLGVPVLVVGHGSNVSYLSNAVRINQNMPTVSYEGLVNPGGNLLFTNIGLFPLTNKREGNTISTPMKDGTALSGFVTCKENPPPRECWHCRHYRCTSTGGECLHPLVNIDPQLQDRKTDSNTIAVGDRDCCDSYQVKLA